MVQQICSTIIITYNSLRNLPRFVEETSYYFTVLAFLAKSFSIDIHLLCRHNANILINIHYLKVC